MDHIEMVEKLRQKANISYEEAKAALEANNWDLLDAMIALEKQGKVHDDPSTYSTADKAEDAKYQPVNATASAKDKNDGFHNFWESCKEIFHKSWVNKFCVSKNGVHAVEMPIILFIALLIFGFWIVLPLMIIGLFFGCRYLFVGEDIKSEDVNNVMSKATDCAQEIKDSIKINVDEAANKESDQK